MEPGGSAPGGGDAWLLERSPELAALERSATAVESPAGGRLVLIAGDAGVGKTALVRAFCATRDETHVLWGACDALLTPRPLAPLTEIAGQLDGELAKIVGVGAAPADLLAALAADLRRGSPAVIVLEDMHWADEATLDLLRVLGRKIATLPAVVIVTYRDGLDRAHPLRVVLGELASGPGVDRLLLRPLSPAAVAALAQPHGVDPERLHRRTGGNPFFVSEVLAARGAGLPDTMLPGTVRDAVLARAARLSAGGRSLLDAVALLPPRADLWLLEHVARDDLPSLDECLTSGMLQSEGLAVGFRHDLARSVIEESLTPWRRLELHRLILAALSAPPSGQPDTARLAHHSEAAGDEAAVLRYAPEAAERAATLGAHREAAAQFQRALRFAGTLPRDQRARLRDRLSYECYLTGQITAAIDARRGALEDHHAAGDLLREGDAHRWLSRLAWFNADNPAAETEALLAVDLLERLPPGPELAMAYSNLGQLGMLTRDWERAVTWGRRAIELAERLGETEILAHALNNVGTAEVENGSDEGWAQLGKSLELALGHGLQEHAARAYTNLASAGVELHEYALAESYLDAGIEYCRDHDLDTWLLYMSGWKARAELEQGRWDAAQETVATVLDHPRVSGMTRIPPLTVLGQLRARRGDPDPLVALDEALQLAEQTGELQRLGPVAAARAEARWLAAEDGSVAGETDVALAMAVALADPWLTGELEAWRRRAGIPPGRAASATAEPYRLQRQGDWRGAARRWAELGCPYEAALARTDSGDEAQMREGLAQLRQLGAWPAARRVARELRQRGVLDVGVGPRSATRRNPAGLTPREVQVLGLIADGLRNSEIAARLFLSEKTVDHHVSSVLRKLGVQTRGQAAEHAVGEGIIEPPDSATGSG